MKAGRAALEQDRKAAQAAQRIQPLLANGGKQLPGQ